MNFKKASVLVMFLALTVTSFAQILEPAKWSWEASKKSVKVGDEMELIFKVEIEDNWHTYANDFDPECGPLLTKIEFKPDASFKLIGPLKAVNAKEHHEEVFDCNTKVFEGRGEFRQKIKILSKDLKNQN